MPSKAKSKSKRKAAGKTKKTKLKEPTAKPQLVESYDGINWTPVPADDVEEEVVSPTDPERHNASSENIVVTLLEAKQFCNYVGQNRRYKKKAEALAEKLRLCLNHLNNEYGEQLDTGTDLFTAHGLSGDTLDRHTRRGKKIIDSAKLGHELVHGTKVARQKKYAEYQGYVNDYLDRHKSCSYDQACRGVAAACGVSYRTIVRRTNKPENKS